MGVWGSRRFCCYEDGQIWGMAVALAGGVWSLMEFGFSPFLSFGFLLFCVDIRGYLEEEFEVMSCLTRLSVPTWLRSLLRVSGASS